MHMVFCFREGNARVCGQELEGGERRGVTPGAGWNSRDHCGHHQQAAHVRHQGWNIPTLTTARSAALLSTSSLSLCI